MIDDASTSKQDCASLVLMSVSDTSLEDYCWPGEDCGHHRLRFAAEALLLSARYWSTHARRLGKHLFSWLMTVKIPREPLVNGSR